MTHSTAAAARSASGKLLFLAAAPLAIALGAGLNPSAAQTPTAPVPVMAPPTASPPNGATPVSLDAAIRMAQASSPAAVQARGLVRSDRASVKAATGALFPNVTLSAGRVLQYGGGATRINSNGEQVQVAQKPTNSTGMSFNVQLFDGGQRLYELRAAKAGVEAAQVSELGAQYTIALNVKQQYYAVLAALESEDAARAQLQQAQAQLKFSIAKVNAGVATYSDSLRGVVQVNNAQLALITAQSNAATASASLTRLVGSQTPITADPSSMSERLGALPDSATLTALSEEGPAVKDARANLLAAKELRKASKTSYLPTLNATYSRNGSGTGEFGLNSDPYAYNGRLSFSASYPVFNGWQREAAIVKADVAQDNAEAALRDAQLAATESLAGYLGALRGASQRIEVQQSTVAAAEEDVRVQQQRYNAGASTLLDLLTSQTALQQARSDLIAARYDYRIARAQIEALIGRDLQ